MELKTVSSAAAFIISVKIISEDRVPDGKAMNTELMRAARFRVEGQPRGYVFN